MATSIFEIINTTKDSKPRKDIIRIKTNKIEVGLNILKGKQGEYVLLFCPAVNLSGYGKTVKEADELLKENLLLFSEDVLSMNNTEREHYLASLGFKKERYKSKNFSKAYVDEDGVLKNFDEGTVERHLLQTA
tara:strand:+ start:8796 stop:9194 length:399 start_codon:yes stop_codon:yes gene_type:complete